MYSKYGFKTKSIDLDLRKKGYQTEYIDSIRMLGIKNDEVQAGFNGIEFQDDFAMWKHIGNEGTVYSPSVGLAKLQENFILP